LRCVPEFSMEEIMKKILSIALIVALAVTSVFAATYNGEADIELGFNLESKDYGFTNTQLRKLKWTITFDSGEAGSEGEGDLRAVIAATFSASQKVADDSELVAESTALPKEAIKYSAAISKADILYKDVVRVGILNAGKSADYAKAFFKNDDKKEINNVAAIDKFAPGFNFTVYGFNGGFGLKGNTEAETVKYFGWVETKSFDLAEGTTAQAAFALAGEKDKVQIAASAKAAYKNEDAKISADFATDFGYKDETAALDLAINGSYDFVTVNVYVGSANKFEDVELAAKASATYKFDGGKVGGYFQAVNIADKDKAVAQEFTVDVNGDYTINEMIKVAADVSYAIKAKKLVVKPAVSYLNEKFTAEAGLELDVVFGDKTKATKIAPYVKVTTDKIINNATLEAGWKNADFAKNEADELKNKGYIYTSCSISF
jgi:hypothetical protein